MTQPAAAHDGRDGERSFLRRHGATVGGGVAALAIVAVLVVVVMRDQKSEPVRKISEIRVVAVQPPPPPPPPPQVQQPKMIEQPQIKEPPIKVDKPLEKPKEAPPKPVANAAPPPGPLALDQKAEGPGDAFNLAGRPGGNGLLDGGGGGGAGRWGWYASQVQTQIEEALRHNSKTRNSRLRVEVRIWPDASGRIDRVQLVTSTGDAGIDAAITNEVLAGMKLREPPPKDMPVPIVTRVTARRPT